MFTEYYFGTPCKCQTENLEKMQYLDDKKISLKKILFSEWRQEATAATKESIEAAKIYVEGMEASGGTNIYEGLKTGLQRIKESSDSSTVVQPMIIFLTDGHATSGRVSTDFVFMANI